MKKLAFLIIFSNLASCGVKVPFDKSIQDKYSLSSEKSLKKVQFYISETIILKKSEASGNQGTNEDGVLVTSSDKTEDRVIFPAYSKCVFDSFGDNQELLIRFEDGIGKYLTFSTRPAMPNGKYYIAPVSDGTNAGKIVYGKESFSISGSGSGTYLMVVQKKLDRTKRKDRVVKGMKV
jgi:hypothetical protein